MIEHDLFMERMEWLQSHSSFHKLLHPPKVNQWYVSSPPHHLGCIWNHTLVLMVSTPC